jgi:hydrogenase nickel incorporation protein HypA/HybF
MHELSIAQALIEQLEDIAVEKKASRILGVKLYVGMLSGVDHEALHMAFPFAAEGTVADGAGIKIIDIEPQAMCGSCGKESLPEFPFMVCGHCGSQDLTVTAGRELIIKSVELETKDDEEK